MCNACKAHPYSHITEETCPVCKKKTAGDNLGPRKRIHHCVFPYEKVTPELVAKAAVVLCFYSNIHNNRLLMKLASNYLYR